MKRSRSTPPEPPRKGRPEALVTKSRPRVSRGADIEAPPVRHRSRASRHPLVLALNLLMLLVVVVVIGGFAAYILGHRLYAANGPLNGDVGIVIERGSDLQSIARGLEEAGIISNQYVFLVAVYARGLAGRLQAGEYEVPAGTSMANVIDIIASGRVVQHAITFAEGLTSTQIVDRMLANEVLSGTVEEIPPEGSLLPETYNFARGMSRQGLIEVMQSAQSRALEEVWASRDPELPVSSPRELVTLASIVEKETGQDDERERVAAVFVNRLNRRMRLQADATSLYGVYGGRAWDEGRAVYQSDLDRPNPYNTYQIDGLPPGPITNPGIAALRATANPADTDELYFVADGTGGHVFARTYEEHQENVQRWRAIEARRAGTSVAE